MRQPRTFSERLALLNRLNRRQVEGRDDDVDSGDDDVVGLVEGVEVDSGSESGDDDISSTDGDIGDPAASPDPGAALPSPPPPVVAEPPPAVSTPPVKPDPPAASPTPAPAKPDPPVTSAAPVKSDPPPAVPKPEPTTSKSQPAATDSPGGLQSVTPPASEPTGIVNNPADPSPSSKEELSTTAQVISQITSAAGAEPTQSVSPSAVVPIVSDSPAQGGENGSPTASVSAPAETTSGAAEAIESGGGGGSGQAMSTGTSVGIAFGSLAGLGLVVSAGLAVYKWRKRRNAAVYDRPAPPGVYTSDEKQAAVMDAAMQAVYAEDNGGPGRPYSDYNVSHSHQEPSSGAYQQVASWVKDTASRFSERTEWTFGPRPEPAFVRADAPAREPIAEPVREPARAAKRLTTMTTMTGMTGSEAKWG